MKKKILVLAMAAICVAIAATGTLAYFTAEDTAHNVITSGAVEIAVEEWQQTDNGLVPYPSAPIQIMPGATVSKIVAVKSMEANAFVRAKFDVTITAKDGTVMQLSPEELANIISLDVNGEAWQRKDGDDDWWYHTEAVASGASTENFFTQVAFDGPNMTNEYQDCTIEITVSAQAVQKANNGSSALEAAGWPEV